MRQSRTRRSTADDARLRGGAQRVARGAKRALHPVVGVVGRPVAATLERALRNSARRGGIALLYHSVDSVRGNPTRELVPAHDTRLFEAQIRYVRERYRIVRAEQLVDAAAARRPGERFPVAITFDDDLACHTSIVAAAPLDRQATATFFLTGASLEEPFTFWWQHLQRALDEGAGSSSTTATTPRGATARFTSWGGRS